jgi:hypothetical protein
MKKIHLVILAWISTALTSIGVLCLTGFFLLAFFFGSIFRYLGSRGEESLSAMELLKSEQWWDSFGWLMITTTTCGVLACMLWIYLMFMTTKEQIFFNQDGITTGPFTETEVDSMLANGLVRQTDFFLRDGVHDWVLVGQSELNTKLPQQQ